ncbi:hypothetical protein M413DRAFT_449955 [Hebeloma cylindrosporum]|uniref:Uncharacterized protein n=1 Tax=Hebeloma cylindrosporum TaxID=76867 RepID=A0A0C2XAI5_HEBCY|nr:hypothetical protein M413DRAFT_449955 [Hebeloma cylindrosporum h7]
MDVDEHREDLHDEDREGVDDEAGEAEVVAEPDRSYIDEDAAVLSHGPTPVLPCTARYMDLTCLNLQYFGRVSKVLLIRDEWDAVIDIFNARKKGIKGSAVWTGQPGIGKTSLLFYILVICLMKAQPIVFQSKNGAVYTIDDQVRKHLGSSEHFLKADVLTLVDGDGKVGEPHDDLTSALNFRILLTSFPRPKTDRRWLTQDVHDPLASFVVGPWQWKEFAITSIFLSESDSTLRRLRKTAKVCGYIPRTVFLAAQSPTALDRTEKMIKADILACDDIENVMWAVVTGNRPIPDSALMICPGDERRTLVQCLVKPISDWARDRIFERIDSQGAYKVYNQIAGHSVAASSSMGKTSSALPVLGYH